MLHIGPKIKTSFLMPKSNYDHICMYKSYFFTSGSVESNVTRGGASFLVKVVTKSESVGNISMSFISTLMADKTTAALA